MKISSTQKELGIELYEIQHSTNLIYSNLDEMKQEYLVQLPKNFVI